MKRAFILFLIFLIAQIIVSFFVFNGFLFAKEGENSIIFYEIMWGKDEDGEEWVELKNLKSEDINLSGWLIENAGRSGKSIKIEKGIIPSKGRFLICETDSKKDFCDIYASISLTNNYQSNGRLILKNKEGKIIDYTPNPKDSSWPAGESEGVSMKRIFLDGEDFNSWQDDSSPVPEGSGISLSANAGPSIISLTGKEITFNASRSTGNIKDFIWNFGDGTSAEGEKVSHRYEFSGNYIVSLLVSNGRKEEKDNISVTVYPGSIFVSEFSPEEEWIEVINESNQVEDISGWGISNKKGKVFFKFPERSFIAPKSFILLSKNLVGSAILQNGGSLFLFYPSGDICQQINYQKWSDSIARKGDEYFYTKTKTPGTDNIISGEVEDGFSQKNNGEISLPLSPSVNRGEGGDLMNNEEEVDKKNISPEIEEVKKPKEGGRATFKDLLSEVKNAKSKMLAAAGVVSFLSGTFGLGLVKLRRRLKNVLQSTKKIEVEIEEN